MLLKAFLYAKSVLLRFQNVENDIFSKYKIVNSWTCERINHISDKITFDFKLIAIKWTKEKGGYEEWLQPG